MTLRIISWVRGASVALLLLGSTTACVSSSRYDAAVRDATATKKELDATRRAQADERAKHAAEVAKLTEEITTLETKSREAQAGLEAASKHSTDLQKSLDEGTAMNAQLRSELERLGKDADRLLRERGTLESSLADARARLSELRRAQDAADARAKLFKDLAMKLKKMVDAGDLSITLRDGRMVLLLPNDVLFDTGRTEIKPAGQKALAQIATVMATVGDRHFQVGGHTDNVPIATPRFPSNWELSSGRALEVVHFLIKKGLRPEALSAAGYGEFDPVAANDTTDGKRRNRRTEISIVPKIDEMVAIPR